MDQQDLIAAASLLMDTPPVRALFLVGSFGRGTADAWSDVDLLAVVEDGQERQVADYWRSHLPQVTPIVFWNELPRGNIVLNAIDENWLRCDLTVAPLKDMGRRAKNLVTPLIDRDGIYDGLPDTLPSRQPDIGAVRYLIHEFIRMLGLMPVALGRQEYVTMVLGVGMMRGHLESLLMQDVTDPDPGGVLHQSKILSPDGMQLLASLPYPTPDRDELVEANLAIAREFMPRARAMAQRLGIEWPEAFEAATRRRLALTLGEDVARSW